MRSTKTTFQKMKSSKVLVAVLCAGLSIGRSNTSVSSEFKLDEIDADANRYVFKNRNQCNYTALNSNKFRGREQHVRRKKGRG